MKIPKKIVACTILTLFVGAAFASAFLINEPVMPYQESLFKGLPADFGVNVVYANFDVRENIGIDVNQDLTSSGNFTTISYFVVLNITNNLDTPAKVDWIDFTACQNISEGTSAFIDNSTSMVGWTAEGAWVDGKWYNITWTNGGYPHVDQSGNIITTSSSDSTANERWIEGVQIVDKYIGDKLATTYINMNGTWTDVTGQITVSRPDENPFTNAVTMKGTFINEKRYFGNSTTSSNKDETGPYHTTVTPQEFNGTWAPYESRLIVLSANRTVLSQFFGTTAALDLLKSGEIAMHTVIQGSRVGSPTTLGDTSAIAKEIKQVRVGATAQGYLYNVVLDKNHLFRVDSSGAEAFVTSAS
jgi:hypothetical protein